MDPSDRSAPLPVENNVCVGSVLGFSFTEMILRVAGYFLPRATYETLLGLLADAILPKLLFTYKV